MKARIQGTHSRTSTMVLTVTLNPIEAERVLECLDVRNDSPHAARLFFMYIASIAEDNRTLQDLINQSDSTDRAEELWRVRQSLTRSGED